MSQFILHLGVHKTGSTWLQEFFFPKIKDLWFWYKPHDPLNIADMGEYPVLISDEELSRSMPTRDDATRMHMIYKLKERYPNAKIILGVRDADAWFKSTYAQEVKSGSYLSFEGYTNKYRDVAYPEYYVTMAKVLWKDVFVYEFKDFIERKDAVLSDMCRFMGVDKPEYEDKRVNTSLKHLGLWRWINILARGEWLRKKIESPYWIITYPLRHIKHTVYCGEKVGRKF